jgi:hypothetical protein
MDGYQSRFRESGCLVIGASLRSSRRKNSGHGEGPGAAGKTNWLAQAIEEIGVKDKSAN